jgi:putative sterol carrier protein
VKDATAEFFETIAERGKFAALHKATGTLRIDLKDNGHITKWFVSMEEGNVTVSHKNGAADCTLQADKETFDKIVTGKSNAMAAILRGTLDFEGDPLLLVLFQRLFGTVNGKRAMPVGAAE